MPSPAEAPEIEHSRKTKKIKEETNLNTHGLQFCQQVRERACVCACLPACAPTEPAIKRALKMGYAVTDELQTVFVSSFFWRNFRQILT
jgi:hypothetical protein